MRISPLVLATLAFNEWVRRNAAEIYPGGALWVEFVYEFPNNASTVG
jgi:hypothetical protein